MSDHAYQFGDWRVEPRNNDLCRDGATVHLEPKVMGVLVCLLERGGDTALSSDILETVWPLQIHAHNVVEQCVSKLRRALGDDSRQPVYIETVTKRGYRAVAPITAKAPRADAPASSAATIAVLTPRDLTPGAELHWLAEGIASELRHQLQYVNGIEVLPHALLRHDGRREAAYILDGDLQQDADTVVARMELTDTRRSSMVWSESFTHAALDPAELQRSIAAQVAGFFQKSALDHDEAPGPSARAAYLKFLHYRQAGDVSDSVFWLETAVDQDPTWAQGYVELAWIYGSRFADMRDSGWIAKACRCLEKAKSLGAEHTDRWIAIMGSHLWRFEGALDGAEQMLRRGVEKHGLGASSFGYALLMLASGLIGDADRYFHRATERAPHEWGHWDVLAVTRALCGDREGALEAARRADELMPPDAPQHWVGTTWALPRLDPDRARHLHAALSREPGPHTGSYLDAMWFEILRQDGTRDEALRFAENIEATSRPMQNAYRFLALDDPRADRYFHEESRPPSASSRNPFVLMLFIDAERRGDPVVQRMLSTLGFTPEWRQTLARRAATLRGTPDLRCDPARCLEDGRPYLGA